MDTNTDINGPPKASNNRIAIALDMDGVLVNGNEPVPGAQETLARLQHDNVPFIFLTNSGGVMEKANVDKLASRLGNISFEESQCIQSHTPFRALVDEYKDKTILVIGGHGDKIREVAQEYGFGHVLTTSDIVAQYEYVHPFAEISKSHHQEFGRKWDPSRPVKVSAIMVWSSPRDWYLDLQVTLDLLLSAGGVVNTRSELNGNPELPNNGYLQEDQPKLFFSNPDFEFSNKHDHPRLAQGGFREALRGIWNHATNRAQLDFSSCGKPTHITSQYAEHALQKLVAANPNFEGNDDFTICLVGDNPAADIAAVNAANSADSPCTHRWCSVLVETGVYRAGTVPAHTPDHIAKDVKAAVEWALENAGTK